MPDSRTLRGIVLCCLAVVLFAALDSLSKYLTPFYGAIVVVWARYVVNTMLLAAWLLPRSGWRALHSACPGVQLLRAFSLLGASLLFISGMRYLPQGEATAVLFIAPLLVILMARPLLGERATLRQWLTLIAGFAGALVIIRPGGGLLTPTILFPLGAALCFAAYQVFSRLIGSRDSIATSSMISGTLGTVCMSLLVPFFWSGTPVPLHLGAMFAQGLIATTGHLLLSQAYRFTSPLVLGPFSYLQILFAALFGACFFDHVPDAGALLGMSIIALSGVSSLLGSRLAAPADSDRRG